MAVLVVGATGATGRLLVAELLQRGQPVKAVVRSPEKLPAALRSHAALSVVQASLLDLNRAELTSLVSDCSAIASCLGHNLTLRGIFGSPRRLVAETLRRLCGAVRTTHPPAPLRLVLMNTVGVRNRDLPEPLSLGQRLAIGLIRLLLPPHADNEAAADYLRGAIGQQDGALSWVVVRPDSLINDEKVSEYEVWPSPTRSAIFNPGKTSRIHVAHFMADLITNDVIWQRWQGQMPVIYNKGIS